jgi:hypothetical protein
VDRPTDRPRPAGRGHVALLVVAGLLASFYLSWRTLAAVDFLYPWFYDIAGVGAHIDRYGPQNRYRSGFGDTTREEREALFAAIARSIRDQGRGLESLTYHDAQGRETGVLLRPAEIVHLRDVARLVHWLEIAGLLALAVLAFHVVAMRRMGIVAPGAGTVLLATLGLVAALTAMTIVIGPVTTFNALHRWIFPADHEWFFFYQDSLMSTMMKAPDLFGYIAVALVGAALVYLWIILAFVARATKRTQSAP